MVKEPLSMTAHDDHVDALFAITQTIRLLEDTRERMIAEARDADVPWQSIAAALGITRQGAQQRYGRPRPDPDQIPLDLDDTGEDLNVDDQGRAL